MKKLKDSGVEWIGEIPADWKVIKNKYLLSLLYSGGTPSVSNNDFYCFEGGTPFVSISDMSTVDYVLSTQKRLTDSGLKDKNLKVLPIGTILYSIYATVGAVSELKIAAAISQAMLALQVNSKVDKSFYKYNLAAMKDYIFSNANGNTQFNLNTEKVKNFYFVLPNVATQHHIANYLDRKCAEIDAIIAKQQQIIEKLKEYKLSVITEAVTKGLDPNVPMKDSGVEWIEEIPEKWQKAKLKNTCQFINGDRSSNYPSPNDYVDKGIPFLGADSLCGRYVDIAQSKKITNEKYRSMGGAKIQKGDILYTLRGSTIGKNAMATFDEGTVASSLMVIRPISLIPEYLLYWLNSEEEFQQRQSCINGSTAPNLSAENVGSFVMFLPSALEQRKIADYLDTKCAEIELTMLKKQVLVDQLGNYKKSLIYEVVTGKKEV